MKLEDLKLKPLNRLIIQHLHEIDFVNTEKEFGMVRLKQKYESFLYSYYEILHRNGVGPIKKYRPFINLTLVHQNLKLKGTILILKEDLIFNTLISKTLSIKSLEKEEIFKSVILHTPTPMIFLPSDPQKRVNGFFSNTENKILIGENEESKFLFMDPLPAYRLGLNFLIKDFIEDPDYYSLLLGFIYK